MEDLEAVQELVENMIYNTDVYDLVVRRGCDLVGHSSIRCPQISAN